MKKLFFFFLMMLLPMVASAYDAFVDGIYYNLNQTDKTASVTFSRQYQPDYSGDVAIPKNITYEGNNYKVTGITANAFYGCGSMTSVTIPSSVTSIGIAAFQSCTSLSAVTLPDNLTTIENNVFQGCSSLVSVVIPNTVKSIGESSFRLCSGLTSISIPDYVTTIGRNAFADCTNLSELSIGKSVESVDGTSFSFCTGLTSVSFHCKAIGQWFGQNYIKEVTIGDEVERIGDGAFSEFLGLTSFKMPNSVTTIGNYAFRNCTNLETIVLSENLNSIGEGGFYGCSTLKKIDLPNSLTSIGNYVFYACHGLNSFVIPNSITGIGEGAFYGCHLSTVTIGSNVKTINNSFNYPIIKTIWLGNTPPTGFQKAIGTVNYVSNDSYQFQYYPGEKYIYPFLSSIFEVDGIRYVPVSPSERICDAIDCVYDSTSVNTTVGSQVSYRGVTMTVRNVMPYLCYNNGYIKSLAWKYGGDLPKYAFAECSNIQQFYTDKSKGIGCLVIDGKVSNIGDYAFSGCKEFDTVIISDRESPLTLGSNGSSPLFSSFALDSVYIGGNLSYPTSKDFGYSPFYSNTTLRSVVITDKETEISPNEFYGCTNLQNVRIGDNVKAIGDYAFSGCSSLKHFAFGTSVETIGREAFSDCVSVGRIISKSKTPPVCGTQALDDINKWDCQLSVPAGCLSAYQAADQWKEFFFVDEKANEEGVIDNPDTPGMQKCATPTVAYKDGQLTLASTTEGAECVWAITSADVRSGRSNTIDLANQYVLTVYATKDGWQDSDRVTATLVWGDAEVEGDNVIRIGAAGGGYDVNGDGQVDVADIAAILSKMAGYSRQVTSDK